MSASLHQLSPIVAGKRKCSPEPDSGSPRGSAQIASEELESVSKRARVKGPALRPPQLDYGSSLSSKSIVSVLSGEGQNHMNGDRKQDDSRSSDSNSDSSSDSDIGPAPPSKATASSNADQAQDVDFSEATLEEAQQATEPQRAERDAWMTMPPTQDDLSARFDPTKLRARKFNTGRGITTTGAGSDMGASSLWTETPEQKRKRLADEVMGVQSKDEMKRKATKSTSGNKSVPEGGGERNNAQRREIAEKIKDHAVLLMRSNLYNEAFLCPICSTTCVHV